MRGRGQGQDGFFGPGDPFAGFGGFPGLGGQGSLISNVFGGRDPFDDPFFTQPFGSAIGASPFGGPFGGGRPLGGSPFGGSPFGSPFGGSPFGSMFGGSMFGPSFIGPGHSPFPHEATGFLENQQQPEPEHHPNKRRGPIIEEINSDDEDEAVEGKNDVQSKHGRVGKEPAVEYRDVEVHERNNNHVQFNNQRMMRNMAPQPPQHKMNQMAAAQPQSQCFTFQSSSVTYGGANGAYYSKSSTRRSGSDGVSFEEHKEADSTTRRATHQVSRGLHNKGHTLTRKLESDGRVDSMQTLHNLDEDELPVFDEAWKGNAKRHLPGLGDRIEGLGANSGGQNREPSRGGWALPSSEQVGPQRQQQNGKRAWSQT